MKLWSASFPFTLLHPPNVKYGLYMPGRNKRKHPYSRNLLYYATASIPGHFTQHKVAVLISNCKFKYILKNPSESLRTSFSTESYSLLFNYLNSAFYAPIFLFLLKVSFTQAFHCAERSPRHFGQQQGPIIKMQFYLTIR